MEIWHKTQLVSKLCDQINFVNKKFTLLYRNRLEQLTEIRSVVEEVIIETQNLTESYEVKPNYVYPVGDQDTLIEQSSW